MMHEDSVLKEAYKVKDALCARYDCDVRKLARAIQAEQDKGERKVVPPPPKRVPA